MVSDPVVVSVDEIRGEDLELKVEYLSSINRIDAFHTALRHSGKSLINLKIFLRIIIFPVQPLLKIFNLAPELICIISKK